MTEVLKSPLARKLGVFVALTTEELEVLGRLHQRRRTFVAGIDLVHQGQSDQAAYILADGWVCSYKLQADGSRQIVDFQIPGDFLGLRSVLLHTSDHGIVPIVNIEAAEVLLGDLLDPSREPRALRRRCSGRRRGTRRWWSSIWSASGGGPPTNGWRISCWNSERGWP